MAAKKKDRTHQPTPAAGPSRPGLGEAAAARAFAAFGALAERFGISFAVFAAIVAIVWLFGNEKTRDDFVREALFGAVTHKPYLSIFLALLLLNTVFPLTNFVRARLAESAELKRVTAERSRLQEKLIGHPLHHTDGEQDRHTGVRVDAQDVHEAEKGTEDLPSEPKRARKGGES